MEASPEALEGVREHLKKAGIAAADTNRGLEARDPWGTRALFAPAV
jgi:hypothetical protein